MRSILAILCATLQHTPTLCNPHIWYEVPCRSLSGRCSPYQRPKNEKKVDAGTRVDCRQHTATHCNTLQYAAIRCNALQHLLLIWGPLQASFRNAPFLSAPKKKKKKKDECRNRCSCVNWNRRRCTLLGPVALLFLNVCVCVRVRFSKKCIM